MNFSAADKRRLNIAMVIDSYDDCKNGAVISTKRFVDLLNKENNVSIITTGKPGPGKILLPKFYPFGARRIMKKMNTPLAIPSKKVLRSTIMKMDLIHVQFPFLLGVRSIMIAKKLHIPVISTFHIQAEHLSMNAGFHSEKFIHYCYKFWMNNIYNRSDMVICPSKFAEDELKKYGLTSPSTILSNGTLSIYQPIKVQRPLVFKDKFIILSVGRFAPEKRHSLIIRAIDRSRYRGMIQLILIGEGPEKEDLLECGKLLPNDPVFLSLSQEELVNYYNLADLYIHAATVEVECMTVLEAMACGLPPLIADSPKSATKQFALDQRSLFTCDNVDDLVGKIDYWISHPEKLEEQRELYYEKSKNYSMAKSFEKLVHIYNSLIN